MVKELMSEYLNKGFYEVGFNGGIFNSGVYFYILKYTDSKGQIFSETKKLLLIK